jgi:hypothetical protein
MYQRKDKITKRMFIKRELIIEVNKQINIQHIILTWLSIPSTFHITHHLPPSPLPPSIEYGTSATEPWGCDLHTTIHVPEGATIKNTVNTTDDIFLQTFSQESKKLKRYLFSFYCLLFCSPVYVFFFVGSFSSFFFFFFFVVYI